MLVFAFHHLLACALNQYIGCLPEGLSVVGAYGMVGGARRTSPCLLINITFSNFPLEIIDQISIQNQTSAVIQMIGYVLALHYALVD